MLTAAKLQEKTGLTRSTLYRFLSALSQHGYVEKTEEGQYCVGKKLIGLVGGYLNDIDLLTVAQPKLWQLSRDLGMSIYMAVRYKMDIVTIACADVRRKKQVYADIGMKMSALCTAMGKCLLANLSQDELEKLLRTSAMDLRLTGPTADAKLRHQVMHEVREHGYIIDDREFDIELRCVAAPIYDYRGEILAAICACGKYNELSLEQCRLFSGKIIDCANDISEQIGYM